MGDWGGGKAGSLHLHRIRVPRSYLGTRSSRPLRGSQRSFTISILRLNHCCFKDDLSVDAWKTRAAPGVQTLWRGIAPFRSQDHPGLVWETKYLASSRAVPKLELHTALCKTALHDHRAPTGTAPSTREGAHTFDTSKRAKSTSQSIPEHFQMDRRSVRQHVERRVAEIAAHGLAKISRRQQLHNATGALSRIERAFACRLESDLGTIPGASGPSRASRSNGSNRTIVADRSSCRSWVVGRRDRSVRWGFGIARFAASLRRATGCENQGAANMDQLHGSPLLAMYRGKTSGP